MTVQVIRYVIYTLIFGGVLYFIAEGAFDGGKPTPAPKPAQAGAAPNPS